MRRKCAFGDRLGHAQQREVSRLMTLIEQTVRQTLKSSCSSTCASPSEFSAANEKPAHTPTKNNAAAVDSVLPPEGDVQARRACAWQPCYVDIRLTKIYKELAACIFSLHVVNPAPPRRPKARRNFRGRKGLQNVVERALRDKQPG